MRTHAVLASVFFTSALISIGPYVMVMKFVFKMLPWGTQVTVCVGGHVHASQLCDSNQGCPQGGQLGHFAPGPSLKGAPGGPMKGPLNTCLKDRYTLIEQSDLNTLIE